MTAALPIGTVTFLFTDIEASTKLLNRVGANEYARVLGAHHQVIRNAVAARAGVVVATEGDSFFVVFTDQQVALQAAIEAQEAVAEDSILAQHGLSVRMGLHTGATTLGGDNYVGIDVHIASRISAAAHGGQILVSDSIASMAPAGAVVTSLGTYWLKDIATPIDLYQVTGRDLRDEFPPIVASPTMPHNAPIVLSSFVGRDAEVEHGISLLGTSRLVTLTGPGGTGKTRLSLAIGSALTNQFKDGVFFVPLAGISDNAGVVSAMLESLGAPPTGGSVSPADYLATYLAAMETLIIVDNFEQLLGSAETLAHVLLASPRTRILVTSRIPLGIDGEQEMHIDPLVKKPAVELFVDRAVSVQPRFEADDPTLQSIEEIVDRLDGLPLAIELAAARVRMMSPRQIADTLQPLTLGQRKAGTPAHQQTLRDTIQWSYDLLSVPEQKLLTRLSIFIGGARLDEIVAVCDPQSIGLDPIAGLDALVEQSLLVAESGLNGFRARMLETIREFGLALLGESAELSEMLGRHSDAYLRLAESSAAEIEGPDATLWMDRLATDHANIESAIETAVASGNAEQAQRMVVALWRYWQARGHIVSGHEHAVNVLAMDGSPISVRAATLGAAGGLAYWGGDVPATRSFYEEALEAHRADGDPAGIADALYNLSFPVADEGGAEESRALLEGARVLAEEQGNIRLLSSVYTAIARSWLSEDGEKTREAAARAVAYSEQLGDSMNLAWAHSLHASALHLLGDYRGALEEQQIALTSFVRYRDIGAMAICVAAIAEMVREVGDNASALFLGGGLSTLWETSGYGLVTFHDESLARFIAPEARSELAEDLQGRFVEGTIATFDEIVDASLSYRIP